MALGTTPPEPAPSPPPTGDKPAVTSPAPAPPARSSRQRARAIVHGGAAPRAEADNVAPAADSQAAGDGYIGVYGTGPDGVRTFRSNP
jgi:hypothetical protein